MAHVPDVECCRCRWCLIDLSGDPWCSRCSPPVRTVPRGLCPFGRPRESVLRCRTPPRVLDVLTEPNPTEEP